MGEDKHKMKTHIRRCWCGNPNLIPFSTNYLKCRVCETLITAWMHEQKEDQRAGQPDGFYGRNYWFAHQQEELHQPDIIQRARQDLPERCIYWLRSVLKYKLPPSNALELGSGHGGFVALLRWSGYEAVGLELSPWVAEFAAETFNVPVLLGPLEQQQVTPHSLDMIIMMDVLEHLTDPNRTLAHCFHLLKPDGIIVIQTPCLPEGTSYEELAARRDCFTTMLLEKEHLHLFSRSSIREFLHRLRAEHLEFEQAIFAHYDMFLIASKAPLQPHTEEEIGEFLNSSPEGRMVQALLDLDQQRQKLLQRYLESEKDRADRLNQIHELTRLLQEPLRAKIWRKLSCTIKRRV